MTNASVYKAQRDQAVKATALLLEMGEDLAEQLSTSAGVILEQAREKRALNKQLDAACADYAKVYSARRDLEAQVDSLTTQLRNANRFLNAARGERNTLRNVLNGRDWQWGEVPA